ncbi:hypothetical protein [Rhizobium sp. P44RR-XXIV]|uniref:hypothetical protein n=1 Tax=Rhizobium sp. P44RR-XXIV TaxID=1921145 RepID=UPI000984AA3D|nr:hypothetical protein [Rhizobium sp. P44RR-XXIV]TIX89196.1 hypothetical protein BSK43_021565 [Rhizobium sp. P44RR-XXIV]
MLLKMLVGLSGPLFNLAPGDEYDFDDDEAIRLKDAGFAVDAAAPASTKKGKADVVSGQGDGTGDAGTGNA